MQGEGCCGKMQNDLHSRKQRQIKAVAAVVGIVVLIVIFWIAVRGVEKKTAGRQRDKAGANNAEAGQEFPKEYGKEEIVELYGDYYTYNHDIETWLFIGTDKSGNETGKGEDYRGSMADVLLLAVFDKTDKTYGFLQLDRDTIAEVTMMQTDGSDYVSADLQICTAHWYGGNPKQSCENTVEAVSGFLGGIPIDGYYSLGMEDIATLNHAVGGVEVTVLGDFSKVDPSLKEGERVLLNDEQAFTYIHDRYGVADETNVQRMQRHNQYMKALFAKVNEKFKESPGFINELYEELEDRAVTNAKGRDLSRIMNQMVGGENRGIYQIEGEAVLGRRLEDGIDHVEFYPDEDSVKEVMTELYHLEIDEDAEVEDDEEEIVWGE